MMKQHRRSATLIRAVTLSAAALLPLAAATSCYENGRLFVEEPSLLPLPDVSADAGGGSGFPDIPDASSGGASAGAGGDVAGGNGGDSGGEGGQSGASAGGNGGTAPDAGASGGAGAEGGASGGAGGDPGQAGSGGAGGGGTPPSDGSCPAQCVRSGGRCSDGTCIFDCESPDSCTVGQLLCPPRTPCLVRCGDRSCVDNVVCGAFAECDVRCEGELSCAAEVICEGDCEVTCSGARSCRGGIGGSVQLLELECSGRESCGSTVQCEGLECRLSCSGPESCARVRTFASDNRVECSGAASCDTSVTCFGGRCEVECDDDACGGGVDCTALDCDVED